MRWIFNLLVTLALGAGVSSFAAPPSPDQATKFLQDYDDAVSRAVLRIDNMAARREQQARLDELAKRAERLFGRPLDSDLGSCVAAASYLRDSWTTQMMMAARQEPSKPFDVASLAQVSFRAGESRHQCKAAIDSLQIAPNKRKP